MSAAGKWYWLLGELASWAVFLYVKIIQGGTLKKSTLRRKKSVNYFVPLVNFKVT